MSEQNVGRWEDGTVPANVRLGPNTVMKGDRALRRFLSKRDPALVIGANATMDLAHFATGEGGCITIGDYCYFTEAMLLCEEAITIGNYVIIGWNATIADSDFHPIDPARRIEDAIACSPLAGGRPRPKFTSRPVVIEDDVWIGPNAAILKGVHIGRGAIIEPGSVVTRDVPPCARVAGNPAEILEDPAP